MQNRLHVVIGGYGRVGRYLARMLEFEGHTVSVIDQDPLVFECAEGEEIMGQKFVGPVFDRDVLEDAGIRDADCFAAVTSRRQQQHRRGSHRARALPRAARHRTHLRPAPRRDLPRPRHLDGRLGDVDELAAARHDHAPGPAQRVPVRQRRSRDGGDRAAGHPRRQDRRRTDTCPARSRSLRSSEAAAPSCRSKAQPSRRTTPCSSTCSARAPTSSSGCSG